MKIALQLALLAAINMLLLFILQWYTVMKLGTGMATDALFAATSIPQLVVNIVTVPLMQVLTPLLAGENSIVLRHQAWGLVCVLIGFFIPLTFVLIVTAHFWVPFTVSGFNADAIALTVELTQIQLLSLVFSVILGVQWAVWHVQQRFIGTEVVSILSNLISLVLLVWQLPGIGIRAAAWAFTLRMVVQALLLVPGLGAFVWPAHFHLLLIRVWRNLYPLLFGTAYYKIDPLIDRWLLSYSIGGNLSLYYLAQQAYAAALNVVNKAITVPLTQQLASLYKANEMMMVLYICQRRILQLGVLLLCVYMLLVGVGQSLLSLFMFYSTLSYLEIRMLWFILIWLGGFLVGGALCQITTNTFYAQGNTVTPTRISIIVFSFYMPFKILAFFQFGLVGLTVVTSAYFLVNFLAQWYFCINQKIGSVLR